MKLTRYWIEEDFKFAVILSEILKPIRLAVEQQSSYDANLLTSEGVFNFLFKTLDSLSVKSDICCEISSAIKTRIEERRQIKLVSLIRFLQNPESLHLNSNGLKCSTNSDIVKLAKDILKKYFSYQYRDADNEPYSEEVQNQ